MSIENGVFTPSHSSGVLCLRTVQTLVYFTNYELAT